MKPWKNMNAGLVFASLGCLGGLGCLPADPGVRAPSAASPTAVHATGDRRVLLYHQRWLPTGAPRALVVVHHGLKDYSDRYAPFATQLASTGIATFAYDMRGHGRSAGPRATLPNFDLLVDDLEAEVALAQREFPNTPTFVLGHSVGGAVVALYATERAPKLAGIILLAPALRVDRMPFEVAATPLVGALVPGAPLVDVPNEAFLSDAASLKQMGEDPFVYQRPGPATTGAHLVDAIARIWEGAARVQTPTFAIHSVVDTATDPRGSRDFIDTIATKDRRLLLVKGIRHDLLHDAEATAIMGEIEAWMNAHLPNADATEVRKLPN
jgi:alpha-beta hydrolase superfamily lysophospholipase